MKAGAAGAGSRSQASEWHVSARGAHTGASRERAATHGAGRPDWAPEVFVMEGRGNGPGRDRMPRPVRQPEDYQWVD